MQVVNNVMHPPPPPKFFEHRFWNYQPNPPRFGEDPLGVGSDLSQVTPFASRSQDNLDAFLALTGSSTRPSSGWDLLSPEASAQPLQTNGGPLAWFGNNSVLSPPTTVIPTPDQFVQNALKDLTDRYTNTSDAYNALTDWTRTFGSNTLVGHAMDLATQTELGMKPVSSMRSYSPPPQVVNELGAGPERPSFAYGEIDQSLAEAYMMLAKSSPEAVANWRTAHNIFLFDGYRGLLKFAGVGGLNNFPGGPPASLRIMNMIEKHVAIPPNQRRRWSQTKSQLSQWMIHHGAELR